MWGYRRSSSIGDESICRDPRVELRKEEMSIRSIEDITPNDHKSHVEVRTKKKALLLVLNYLSEYCKFSSVHGLRYLSEEHQSCLEKLFWATAIVISAFGCSMMIAAIKTKMDTTPMIVTMVENPTKVWHVPFPAVTVCPGQSTRESAFNLTRFYRLSETNSTFWDDFLSWVNESKISQSRHTFSDSFQISDYNDIFNETSWIGNSTLRNSLYRKLWALFTLGSLPRPYPGSKGTLPLDESDVDFLVEVAMKMRSGKNASNVLESNSVYWKDKTTFLDVHFKHLWTDFGLCFTFNMMDNIHVYRDGIVNNDVFQRKGLDRSFPRASNDWDPDKGYRVLRRQTYPWRAPHERRREKNSFTVIMVENVEEITEYYGKGSADYWILFHEPQEHPMFSTNNAINMPFRKLLDVTIKIGVMTTSPKLAKYDPHKRQCYYSHEKRLEYFKFYSEKNCHLECMTNVSLKMCGCVTIYMPRYKTTKICGIDADNCLANAILQFDESEMDATLEDLSESGNSPFNAADSHAECDCLPSCLSVSYEADVLTTRDFDSSLLKALDDNGTGFEENQTYDEFIVSGVWVRIKNNVFTASQRSEYYGRIDFLANCGGILGLFLGLSILSLIEIIYFFTIRPWISLYQRLKARQPLSLPAYLRSDENPGRKVSFNVPPMRNPSSSSACRACQKRSGGARR